jgi:hypothetical protein
MNNKIVCEIQLKHQYLCLFSAFCRQMKCFMIVKWKAKLIWLKEHIQLIHNSQLAGWPACTLPCQTVDYDESYSNMQCLCCLVISILVALLCRRHNNHDTFIYWMQMQYKFPKVRSYIKQQQSISLINLYGFRWLYICYMHYFEGTL